MSFAVEAIRLAESCVGEGLLHELDGPLEHIELSENEHVSLDDENFHLWRDNKDQLANCKFFLKLAITKLILYRRAYATCRSRRLWRSLACQ